MMDVFDDGSLAFQWLNETEVVGGSWTRKNDNVICVDIERQNGPVCKILERNGAGMAWRTEGDVAPTSDFLDRGVAVSMSEWRLADQVPPTVDRPFMVHGRTLQDQEIWSALLMPDGQFLFAGSSGRVTYGRYRPFRGGACFQYEGQAEEHCRFPQEAEDGRRLWSRVDGSAPTSEIVAVREKSGSASTVPLKRTAPGASAAMVSLERDYRELPCGRLAPDGVRSLSVTGAGSAAARCTITVEPNALAIVTLGRIAGDAELDLIVAESVSSPDRAAGVIGSSDAPDANMDLVVIPPSTERRRFEVLAHQVGAGRGEYQVRLNSRPVHEPVLKGLLLAGGHMLFEAFFDSFLGLPYDPQSSQDRNIDRALTIGLSSIMRENPYQIGLDFAMNEARLQVERAFPNDRELQIVVFQVIGQVAQVIARDATRIQTLRDRN